MLFPGAADSFADLARVFCGARFGQACGELGQFRLEEVGLLGVDRPVLLRTRRRIAIEQGFVTAGLGHPLGLLRAQVFVDLVATAVGNGEVARAIGLGMYTADRIAGELGDVLAGRVPGRTSDDQITIATLTGIGAQDLAAARVVMAKLEARHPAG